MRKSKGTRKTIALSFLLILFTQTFAPYFSYALTSGPTQPEATSFEPVDTTEMVNLQTGDFSYSIPLLDIPGPDGGYPLALAYHAGMQPNADASWVGLGWNLNPGAINRNVNGVPDDLPVNSTSSVRTYWSGGVQSTINIGVNIGMAQSPISVSAGLTVSRDTYKGVGVGYNFGFGTGLEDFGNGAGLGVGVSFTKNPYESKLNAQDQEGLSFDHYMGVSASLKSIEAGYVNGYSRLGATISSNQNGAGSNLIGSKNVSRSSKDPGIETSTNGFSLTIPISNLITASLSYSRTRYWTDETSGGHTGGSLSSQRGGALSVFDSYSLLEDPSSRNIVDWPDPTVLQGGSYRSFDNYDVAAQGLWGEMRPYEFQGNVCEPNHYDQSSVLVIDCRSPTNYNNSVPGGFRFEGDFSNSFQQADNQYGASDNITTVTPPFDTAPIYDTYGANNGQSQYGLNGIALEGSRHIDMGVKILPYNILGYNTPNRLSPGMINGFSITNESGVTYHYGLPAYSFGEVSYQEKISRATGLYFNRTVRPYAYAYTWYLTSITGPDFVDRNGDGMADAGDWGYWVNFEYGKWSNNYVWRNPSEFFQRDDDNNFQNLSMGSREVYYLNAIRTRSHIALFEKSPRYDAKAESPAISILSAASDYANPQGVFDINSSQSMKLDHIYILNIADANIVTPGMGGSSIYQPTGTRSFPCSDCEQSQYTLDQSDVNTVGRSVLEAKALRVIDFNYDYSLSQNTTNSFDINNLNARYGKLTLLNYLVRGKGGANLLPPTRFNYDLTGSDIVSQSNASLTSASGATPANFTTTNGNFNVGDLIYGDYSGGTYYCGAISSKTLNGSTYTYNLVNCNYTYSPTISVTVRTTKNPPYNKDFYDAWGMYKSDADLSILAANENFGRNTTTVSSKSKDVWSLHSIISPLGDNVKIAYESDDFNHSGMTNIFSYVMQNISVNPSDMKTVQFTLANVGSTVSYPLTVGQYLTNIQLAVYVEDSHQNARRYLVASTTSTGATLLGGFTVDVLSTTNGITTVTGHLDNPIPTSFNNQDMVGSSFNQYCTGNLWVTQNGDSYGDGLRVKTITSNHIFDNSSSSLSYAYQNALGRSSGVTSFAPAVLDVCDYDDLSNPAPWNGHSLPQNSLSYDLQKYRERLYANVSILYPIANELPYPGVIYEFVTVTNLQKNQDEANTRTIEGATQYQFEVFKNNMIGREDAKPPMGNTGKYPVIRKLMSAIGNLKRVTVFDKDNHKLSETINHYLHDNLENSCTNFHDFFVAYLPLLQSYHLQGFMHERFAEVKVIPTAYVNPYELNLAGLPYDVPGGYFGTLSSREEYPSILTGQTQINYVNGFQTSTTNLAFDFYSGRVTKTLETDAYGNNIETDLTPAYQIRSQNAQYAAMGLKINAPTNKNMLSQIAETDKWVVDGAAVPNHLGLISSTTSVWDDQTPVIDQNGAAYTQNDVNPVDHIGDIWRTRMTYDYLPSGQTTNGLTLPANFPAFNFTTPSSSDPAWKKTSETTLYDVFSKAMEENDINNNYSSIHLNYDDQKIILSGGAANFYETAYSGAEDNNLGQTSSLFIQPGTGTIASGAGVTHTGIHSLILNPGQKGFIYSVPTNKLTIGRTYQASVWVKPASGSISNVSLYYDINGGTAMPCQYSSANSSKIANGWVLINLNIPGSAITAGNTLDVFCRNDHATITSYVDDIRFQPINATTTAYVYDPFSGELTNILDNSNIYTRFEYDAVGRLLRVYKEKLGLAEFKTKEYQYNIGTYLSDPVSQSFTKNDCVAGNIGNSTTITVPAGAFTSTVSVLDADAQASQYAQSQANLMGTCIPPVTVIVPSGVNIAVSFSQGGVTKYSGTFSAGTTPFNYVLSGTYDVNVVITSGGSHNIKLSSMYTTFGTNVIFSSSPIIQPVTITIF